MSENDDDLVIRSLASADPEVAAGAEQRSARFQTSMAAIEIDAEERARIDRIAAEADITDQDDSMPAPGGTTVPSTSTETGQPAGGPDIAPAWPYIRCNSTTYFT